MKKIIVGITVLSITALSLLQSCDKVDNPYPKQYVDIDTTLLSGITLQGYKNTMWPTFSQNTNTNVNVMIEDFTGHQCSNCPNATAVVESIVAQHPDRVFVASIHSGPGGNTGLQAVDATFTQNFMNPQGIEIATVLTADEPSVVGNPFVDINRKIYGGTKFPGVSNSWPGYTTDILNANVLNVNLQSKTNYFPSTRGVILHTEVELLGSTVPDDLYQVVYLIEDSLISIQKTLSSWNPPYQDVNYVHRDIHRGCIDGNAMGRKLVASMKVDKNGNALTGNKYYLNYSYKLPAQYDENHTHLIIFVQNKTTKEVLQVIEQKIIE